MSKANDIPVNANDNFINNFSLANNPSARFLILNSFLDSSVFDPTYEEYTGKILEDVKGILKKHNVYTYVESKVTNVDNNIRAALQSIDGYQYIDSSGAERWIEQYEVYNDEPFKRSNLYFYFKGMDNDDVNSESEASVRSIILKILCNQTLFPIRYVDYSKGIINIVKSKLEEDGICEEVRSRVKSLDNSIRQALETIDGYNYSNNTTLKPVRKMEKERVPDHDSSNFYRIRYTFL